MNKWSLAAYHRGVSEAMPQISGVYVLARVHRVTGFPIQVEAIYVGRSLNLRRRTVEHQHLLEPNPGLNGRTDGTLEIWWQPVDRAELNKREAELIRNLKPRANRLGKTNKGMN